MSRLKKIIRINKCPKCKSKNDVIPIQYGYPSVRMFEERESGKIELGGCIVAPENPNWYCKKCDHRWK
ncbi:MAG: hypothetical protein M0Q91_05890 [Methanoregula sp.]|jgi:hypothetical protein|nr:hypothetical protein [Methanoregula sp.]